MRGHGIILTDRGLGHIHRWAVACECGHWHGIHRKYRRRASRDFRSHLRTLQPDRRRRVPLPLPRPLTPPDHLPEELRVPEFPPTSNEAVR